MFKVYRRRKTEQNKKKELPSIARNVESKRHIIPVGRKDTLEGNRKGVWKLLFRSWQSVLPTPNLKMTY